MPKEMVQAARDAGLNKLASRLEQIAWKNLDHDEANKEISTRRHEFVAQQPDEFGPCSDLVDLAIEAANMGHRDLAKSCFETGLDRGFRYGHRKDSFLFDVWEALLAADPELADNVGLAIQLLNWSRHLHRVTEDGKGIRWIEGEILEKFLDLDLVDLDTARDLTDHPETRDTLTDWSIRNRSTFDADEWDAMLNVVRQSTPDWKGTKAARLTLLAEQAIQRGDVEAGRELLQEAVDDHNVSDRFDEQDLERFHTLAALHAPHLVNSIQLKEDPHAPKPWVPTTNIGRAIQAEEFCQDLLDQHVGQLTDGFHDLWSSKDGAYQGHALSILDRIMKMDPDAGWQAAANAFSISKMARGWGTGFKPLCERLMKQDAERTLRLGLDAWRSDPIQGRPYGYGNLPNLCWLVKCTTGKTDAMEVVRDAVDILRRTLQPHDNRVQVWGRIQQPWDVD